MAAKQTLRPSETQILQSASAVAVGTEYGLPAKAIQFDYQIVAAGAVTVLIQGSIDGVNWYTLATSAAAASGSGTVRTSATLIRSNITVNAGGSATVVSINPKIYGELYRIATRVKSVLYQSGLQVVAPANDTAENILATFIIPGGLMKRNGMLRLVLMWSFTGSTNNKLLRIRMTSAAGTQLFLTTQAVVGNLEYTVDFIIQNQNSLVAQICRGAAQWGAAAVAPVTTAIDTEANWTVVVTAEKATGSETVNLEHFSVEVVPFD